jgi:hypothetical protein
MSGIGMLFLSGGSSVRITDRSIEDTDFVILPATAFAEATYQLGSDGVARFLRASEGNGVYSPEWLLGGSASNYEVRFTSLSGSPSAVAFDTWLPLTSSRSVSVSASQPGFGETTNTGTVKVEIRTSSGLILSSATITLSATATVDA